MIKMRGNNFGKDYDNKLYRFKVTKSKLVVFTLLPIGVKWGSFKGIWWLDPSPRISDVIDLRYSLGFRILIASQVILMSRQG